MIFEDTLDRLLMERDETIWEGVVLNVNTMISNAISVPEGEYRVLLKDSDTCQLITTTEASGQKQYEVLRPTLTGFFNPEVHRRIVVAPSGKFLVEAAKRG